MKTFPSRKPNYKDLVRQHEDLHITVDQRQYIRDLMEKKGISVGDIIDDGFPPLEKLTRGIASELLDHLLNTKEQHYLIRESGGPQRINELIN